MLAGLVAVVLVLATACSQAAPAAAKPDFRTCRGFLETGEATEITGLANLEQELRPVTEKAKAQTPSISGYCQVNFYLSGRALAMTLTAIRYDSGEAAQAQYHKIVEGFRLTAGSRFSDGALGTDSFSAEINSQGVGSFVGFLRSADLVQISTAIPAGGSPPATADQLAKLAEKVRSRLA